MDLQVQGHTVASEESPKFVKPIHSGLDSFLNGLDSFFLSTKVVWTVFLVVCISF